MRARFKDLRALPVLALVCACGSGDSGAGTTAGNHCAGVVAAMAEVSERCLGAPALAISAASAQATAHWVDVCRSLATDEAAGRLSYDAAKGTACVDALQSVACSDLAGTFPPLVSGLAQLDDAIWTVLFGPPSGLMAPSPLDGTTLSVCEGVMAGRVPIASPCSATIQCADGWCEGAIDELGVASAGSACPGTCAPLPSEGETCAGGRARCAAGLVCHEEPLSGPLHHVALVCRRIAGAGEACQGSGTSGRCASGFFCNAATAVCTRVGDIGGPCSSDASCRPDLWCNIASGTCAATTAEGPCNGSGCEMASFCDLPSRSCRDIPGPGAPCTPTPSTSWTCVDGFYCDPVSSRCIAFPIPGETCSVNVGCRPGFCDPSTVTCVALRPEGAACDPQVGLQCQGRDGFCDPGTDTCTSRACALP